MAKMTKNEKITIVISCVALLITLTQFCISLPYFSSKLYRAEVSGKKVYTHTQNQIVQNTFMVTNKGNKSADELEIALVCRVEDSVEIIANSMSDVKYSKVDGAKKVTVKFQHFIPAESIFLMVFSDESKKNLNFFTKPNLINIKFSEGFGRIDFGKDKNMTFKTKLGVHEFFDSIGHAKIIHMTTTSGNSGLKQ